MLRFQLLLVGLLSGALILAGFGNKHLRDQLNRANRTLHAANKTDISLRFCKTSLKEQRLVVQRVESDKKMLASKINGMSAEITGLKKKADLLPEKDKEIATLKAEIQKSSKAENDLKKRLQEAEKALDTLGKMEEARKAKEAQEKKQQPSNGPTTKAAPKA